MLRVTAGEASFEENHGLRYVHEARSGYGRPSISMIEKSGRNSVCFDQEKRFIRRSDRDGKENPFTNKPSNRLQ